MAKILRFYVDFIAIGATSARREASPLGERIAINLSIERVKISQ